MSSSSLPKRALEFKAEFERSHSKYKKTMAHVSSILTGAIGNSGIVCLPLQARVKDPSSAAEKMARKSYKDPLSEMTDLVGFRIIVYLESDIESIETAIRSNFDVNDGESIDKRKPDNVRAVGYRSLHLICSLGNVRKDLPEYKGLCDINFEIQVRTVLEHTWAEIEHKQNYKSPQALPPDLQRRLFVLAGTLELVDRELASIASDAQRYAKQVSDSPEDVELDTLSETSLTATFERIVSEDPDDNVRPIPEDSYLKDLLAELRSFGIETVGELNALIKKHNHRRLRNPNADRNTVYGFMRSLMFVEDFRAYFTNSFRNDYRFSHEEIEFFQELTGEPEFLDAAIEAKAFEP